MKVIALLFDAAGIAVMVFALGFMFSGNGFLNVYLGRQSHDSATEQR